MKLSLGARAYVDVNLIAPQAANFSALLSHIRSQIPAKPFDLLGFSMGGYAALALALEGVLPIRRLILINSRAGDDEDHEVDMRARTLRLLANSKVRFEGMSRHLFRSLVGPDHQDDHLLFTQVQAMAQAVGRRATAAQIRANQTRPDMRARLGELNLPTLIIGGELDTLTPPRHAKNLHQGIKGSQVHILPGCGHLSPLERPVEVAALVERFLAD